MLPELIKEIADKAVAKCKDIKKVIVVKNNNKKNQDRQA